MELRHLRHLVPAARLAVRTACARATNRVRIGYAPAWLPGGVRRALQRLAPALPLLDASLEPGHGREPIEAVRGERLDAAVVSDVAAASRVNRRIDSRLVDQAVDAYVDWREECTAVWRAYGWWRGATAVDAPLAFSAYRAAIDREECAARVSAALMTRIAVALNRERQTPPGSCPDQRDHPGHTAASPSERVEFWLSGDQGLPGTR